MGFHRRDDSTDNSPLGPLRLCEIAVQDLVTTVTYKGADCVKLLFQYIPAYWPCLVLFKLAFFLNMVDRQVRACIDGSCAIPDALPRKD